MSSATILDPLAELGVLPVNHGASTGSWLDTRGPELVSFNPSTGEPIARVAQATPDDYESVVRAASCAFDSWRMVPAPKRGEIVRQLGEELRAHKDALGRLVSLEAGKIRSEGLGEVQEMIDVCDFAVGLSRQLYGLTMHSERPQHRMYEQWHPLGPIGIVTAFNFPVAVWAWNAAIAAVCGDTMIWKPSSKTPLTAIAVQNIANRVMERNDCPGVFNLVIGRGADVGERMLADRRLPLISATGSCRMGRRIAVVVGERLGRTLLELGGNNAIIVLDDANIDLAVRAVLFGAVGTAGQRCTSTRRLIVQKGIAGEMVTRLKAAYAHIRIGDPVDSGTLMGPLIDGGPSTRCSRRSSACGRKEARSSAAARASLAPVTSSNRRSSACKREWRRRRTRPSRPFSTSTRWTRSRRRSPSRTTFRRDCRRRSSPTACRSAESFLSHRGSDCGIANVNIGTSGAEIGGAFGGEKETGGGRESGSDAWKSYMRRQTNTINWGSDLPLAQGVTFEL